MDQAGDAGRDHSVLIVEDGVRDGGASDVVLLRLVDAPVEAELAVERA